ncbi:MAG: CHAT domain-containing protein [Desulfobacterales bacterium]|nr:CHAT domain-containing protein [Desulfobacterales bacterium]
MKAKQIFLHFLLLVLYFISSLIIDRNFVFANTDASQDSGQLIAQGKEFYLKGDFEHAASSWEKALTLLDVKKEPGIYSDTSVHLASAYQALGYHNKALPVLLKALPIVETSKDQSRYILFLSSLSDLYFSMENLPDAIKYLEKGVEEARSANDPWLLANMLNNVGNLLAAEMDYYGALAAYGECIDLMEPDDKSGKEKPDDKKFPELKSKVVLNAVRAAFLSRNYKETGDALDYALLEIGNLPDSYNKARDMIALSLLIQEIQKKLYVSYKLTEESFDILKKGGVPEETVEKLKILKDEVFTDQDEFVYVLEGVIGKYQAIWYKWLIMEYATLDLADSDLTGYAYATLDEARRIALELNDPRTISYAHGYMGQLYEREKKYQEAIKLTRSAIFYAQQGNFPQTLYLWQWQSGRIFKATEDIENAVKAYKNAISTLNPIRGELFKGYRGRHDAFNKSVKPVYLGLAELLLKQGEKLQDDKARQDKLRQARDTMELLKTAELEDFFKDECVTAMQTNRTTLDRTEPHTAVLYPILLPDSLALLLTLPDGIKNINVRIGSEALRETVKEYRKQLQTRPNNRFLYFSQRLFEWIIRPIESDLASYEIDTIIVAPDGVLRLIPFSTLHDGKHFLIEKYAIGTIPAISLTDPGPLDKENLKILLGGLSEGVQDFSPLPSVTAELRDIKQIMDGKILIQNEEYTIDNLIREFKAQEYSIVHIATHGVFGGSPQDSFLLTYESKLNMDLLENLINVGRFRKQKVELLTLSACQTALGNERAAMGLAGVAVKAGVKGAIATLWYVDDEATSLAIREFYRQLRKPGVSKAKAMQNVQKKLIAQRRYWHPLYWAPFLVIGNWK